MVVSTVHPKSAPEPETIKSMSTQTTKSQQISFSISILTSVFGLVVEVLVVVFGYYGSEGVFINCCSRHCSIGNCRTGEGCTRSGGFWRSRVIFCGFGNPGFLVVVVELVVYHDSS